MKNGGWRKEKKLSSKGTEKIFNKIIKEKFSNLKKEMPIKVKDTYIIPC